LKSDLAILIGFAVFFNGFAILSYKKTN